MKKVSLLAVLCLLVATLASAGTRVALHQAQEGSKNESFARLTSTLELGAYSALNTLAVYNGPSGKLITRYQQTFHGIPIWGEHIIISTDPSGTVIDMHGFAVQGIDDEVFNVTPTFSAGRALATMKSQAGFSDSALYENEKSELVIYNGGPTAKLAYAVSYFTDSFGGGSPSRPFFILDAETAEILFQYEGLTTANGTGPGGNAKTGEYHYGPGGNGTQFAPFEVAQSGSTCTMNTINVKTVNLNHGTSGSTAYSYTCSENTFQQINGAFCPLNDAHFFGGVIFDMYSDWYATAPLTFQLSMRVHYSTNYENAFWNGSSMTFGDGQNTFHPLVSLDVSAHEVSHGFTEQNSALVYSAQSGGINEAFSDIAGESAEYYMLGSNDWQVGADIFKGSGALRYMDNPPLDGSSIGSANDYVSGMDVHFSSGVFNKAFYLLSTTVGWDTHKAFDVFVKANQLYWSPNTDYADGRVGCMSAATDLGYDTAAVAAAFDAVDVGGSAPPTPATELVNGASVPNLSANTGEYHNYFISVPAGATNLVITTAGSDVDADLYQRFGAQPTSTTYDNRSITSSSNESITIAAPAAGDHYFSVYAYSNYTALTLTVNYTSTVPNVAPTAGFTSSVSNLTANFTDTSSDSDGTVVTWAWTFGDGSTSSIQNPSQTYGSGGTYTVGLTVTDDDGATDSTSGSVTVTAPPNNAPTAAFTSSSSGLTASFTDTSSDSDGTIASWAWAFGDSGTSISQSPSNTYSADGTYTVTLTVTDDDGATDSASASVTVAAGGGGGVLDNGVPVTGISGTQGDFDFFTIEVPANATSLNVVISGGSGDADMYVRFGAQPTTASYDCRPYVSGNNENCSFTNPAAGTWHIGIRAYSTYSGVSLTATYVVGGSCPPYSDSVSGLAASSGNWLYYTQDVPACATNLTVTITGGSGDADLYINYGAQPTTSTYSCRPYRNGNEETCSVDNPTTGTWHIGLRAYTTFSGVTLTVSYD